ncbi:MAG: hypothetical protein QOE65_1091 [Solirubrobacteraceae bacterium]|jgi:hypothetical protein|nr:hypothetical protein [Solirubrobacteraceae bacterium]
MVRMKLDEGPDLLVQASLRDATNALEAALDANELLQIHTSNGRVAVNPHRVLYLEEEESEVGQEAQGQAAETAGAA